MAQAFGAMVANGHVTADLLERLLPFFTGHRALHALIQRSASVVRLHGAQDGVFWCALVRHVEARVPILGEA